LNLPSKRITSLQHLQRVWNEQLSKSHYFKSV
jgi:hypothetical protein